MWNSSRGIRRFDARIALILLRPPQAGRNTLFCILLFSVVGLFILIGFKNDQDLFEDSAEAYAWGKQFLGGYGRHPPMTGWIAGLWYSVFPAANWSSHALARVMTGVSLVSIYLITQLVLDHRRAVLVLFAMMLYPFFVGASSDVFNNYSVLLAILPLTVWLFLRALERRTARSGFALGLAAAAATLTIYSAVFGLAGMAIAAIVHPDRRKFFGSPAPYAAGLTYLAVVTPHIVWLVRWNFPSIHWASSLSERRPFLPGQIVSYFGNHAGLIAFSLIGGAIALWPWRFRKTGLDKPFPAERLSVVTIAIALMLVPAVLAPLLGVPLLAAWGNSLFFLAPTTLMLFLPRLLVTRAAVVRSAKIAAIFTILLLLGAPFYAWANFQIRPEYAAYTPYSEAATEVTRLWHERYGSPLPIVVARFEIATRVEFYSSDHPKMFADFYYPSYSPWIDFPTELERDGYVGVCRVEDAACRAYLYALKPDSDQLDIDVFRQMGNTRTPSLRLHLQFSRPKKLL
jgi:4-amino-4-deoxy-L-arabinose transferase-like glycosyltransferase